MTKTFTPIGVRVVNRSEAIAGGVSPEDLVPLNDALASTVAAYTRANAWFEEKIGDGWVAAYRMAADDEGRPIVAEVRVFPDEWAAGPDARPPGVWAGEYVGPSAKVPPRGLSTTVLRKVSVATPFRNARAGLDRLRVAFPGLFKDSPLAALAEKKPGPPRIDDLSLARLADAYVKAGYSRKAVATQLRVKESTIRGRLRLARARDLLTQPRGVGRREGFLTPRAEQILARAARPKRSPKTSARKAGRKVKR
jgi:hypothetical protein